MKKTALVTGGNKGIGLMITRFFIERGYKVIVVARDFSNFSLANNLDVQQIQYDLSSISGITNLISSMDNIDVLINNAGVMLSLPYSDYPPDKIDLIIKLNLLAPVELIREVSKKMMKNGGGRIVNNASIAGQIGHPDIWYGITKAGIINVTKSFAKLLGPYGIIVNAVAPSPVDTDMLNVIPEDRKNIFKKNVISGRFATASEIAETIGWLGTQSPEYINGTCIDINNGSFPR